jgi:anti-anti-sigma factor
MQITTDDSGEPLEMHLAGRLDNESTDYFNAAIDNLIRQGRRTVVVHLVEVSYLSSAGLGALIRAHKKLQAVRGFFGVGSTSSVASEVIRLTGLAKMLLCDVETLRRSPAIGRTTAMPNYRIAAPAGLQFEIYDLEPGATFTCSTFGEPGQLDQGYVGDDCRSVRFAKDSLGLGVGAFGSDFAQAAPQFGEFLAVAGSAVQQPTSGSDRPDYQIAAGDYVPNVQMVYGLRCTGAPSLLIRFESDAESRRTRFSELVDQCLLQTNAPQAAMVFVAESAGLIGARLRRSPASTNEKASGRLVHPEIRRWLSFTPERAFQHTLALIVGVASRGAPAVGSAVPASLLRPLRAEADVWGHFHAAVFSYRPFKKRRIDLSETVASLFENEDLQALMHLLNDDRAISGGGESELVAGACWTAPLVAAVATEAA